MPHQARKALQSDLDGLRLENQELRLWQEQFAAILDALHEGVQVVNQAGVVTYVNKSFETILGERAKDRLGKNIYLISPNGALVETLRSGEPVFGKIHATLEKGKVVSSNSAPIKINGALAGAVCVFADISDIRRLSKLLEKSERQVRQLQEQVMSIAHASYTLDDIVGTSQALRRCVEMARKMANSSATVLLAGESGTGKELFAHGIHNAGKRAKAPFIKINCAAIPEQLLESEFFGYERGAFTGADKAKMGKFELAHTGTLFLDEIGEMNLAIQAKLLRVIQDKEVERLGGERLIRVDVRVIAATNKNLEQEVAQGRFRQDLYYRLNMLHIEVPPLRSRPEDIPIIAEHLIGRLNQEFDSNFALSPQRKKAMKSMPWPGNVRQMENYLGKQVLFPESDAGTSPPLEGEPQPIPVSLEENEMQLIFRTLDKYGYDLVGKQRAAKELHIALSTLYNKLKKYK